MNLTEAVVAASGPGEVAGAARGGGEVRRRGAAVQMTVKMVVDVPVLLYDKFPQSCSANSTVRSRPWGR